MRADVVNSGFKKPNIEMVRAFVEGGSDEQIAAYNFRNEYGPLQGRADGVVGFKHYKQASRRGSGFDCDCCELVMSICCLLLAAGKNVSEVIGYDGRSIHFVDSKGQPDIAETETINSFETQFNKYGRRMIESGYKNKWHHLYERGAGLVNGKVVEGIFPEEFRRRNEFNRDKWLLDYYPEIFSDTVLHRAYETLADSVHQIGNLMIGPDGFNARDSRAKGKCLDDRFDLFFEKVNNQADYSDWKLWFDQYRDVNRLELYFKEDGAPKHLRTGSEIEIIARQERLIRDRGIVIVRQLRSLLGSR